MRALKPRARYCAYCGIAIAARMPTMATTTRSSISVKPFDFFLFSFETLRMRPPFGLDGSVPVAGPELRSKPGATNPACVLPREVGARYDLTTLSHGECRVLSVTRRIGA